ncbi:hypothetical protein GYH30_049234 [Glycine max]|uniref:uncharacterized protein n=1 Tax=Glycine max TaxID=3847 RepID=UPI0003DEB602|nr:uncharacterized protein LOC102662755 [Glycine max]KAG4923674.1 hypothetical protein JHK87_049214 [Glycine soja]KAH1153500.1 hypothetical protein GYH30_049234 [Glycine max]|eukprot:XP_025982571.1 uncharacterized protein LOC102662755 [Glycine max]
MVSPQGRNTWTVDDLVPYVEKLTILSEEQERIIEPVSHGPFTQYPAQMYHYRSEGHQSDTSASEHSLGGVTKTYPNFSWPTMTPSQQHDAPSPEADQVEEGRYHGRRNSDKQARIWEHSCGTSSHHHGHHDD